MLWCSLAMARKSTSPRKRLDVLLVERGIASSRQRAQALILARHVLVNGQRADKPGTPVALDAALQITGEAIPFVSRGGVKLAGALDDFAIPVEGRICLDVGSSTGGFTDCLLQRGAARVYAVDVSTAQLDWKLRQDARVILVERNARYLKPADVSGVRTPVESAGLPKPEPETPDLVTMDVSFISVTKILPAIVAAAPQAEFLILIKPQFELERGDIGKGGIVRDPKLHERAVERVHAAAEMAGLICEGVRPSRLAGAEGNQEFFLHARRSG
jgi:23S rRNA (cytidine1920-2'-O)/16S rRNA (cytidine1409-2'-O)-methyltransferase